MKTIIAGSSGMVGNLLLHRCLESDQISEVVSLVRKPSELTFPKLTEVVIEDFEDYSNHDALFSDVNMAFFCIGVYTGQVKDDLFKKITVDYAVNFAKAVQKNNADATFCLLSGAGADRTEKSRTSFAKYKGMAENQIDDLGLKFYSFRPGYIYPVEKRKEPNFMYRVSRSLYPLIRLFGKNASIKSTELADAMFHVGVNGADKDVLENREILGIINN